MNRDEIVAAITHSFPTFGGGRIADGNPIAAAVKSKPPMFALGVDVGEVVSFVLKAAKTRKRK